MIDSIIIQNMRTNETITMDKTGNTGYVISEIDWDEANVTNESYRIPFQIGETLSSTVVGTRVPTITGYVVSDIVPQLGTKWNDYFKQQKEDIIEKKDYLNKFISIYDTYRIIAGEYYIEGIPRKALKYSYQENENNEVLCLFEIELGCYDPTFKKVGGSAIKFIEIDNMFHLPTYSTDEKPVVFGVEKIVNQKIIYNNGDVSTGFIAIIRPYNGTVKDFTIINQMTGEQIKISKQLTEGKYIYYNTLLGQEDVYIINQETGKEQSLISEISIDSAFIQLQRGENSLLYTVGDESTGVLNIEIEYYERFFNIKEM